MTWTSEELAASTCHGSLTIGSTSMNNKAWASLNNFVLWQPAPRRGSNLLIGGRAGRIAFERRKDESQRTLEVLIIGDCNTVGTPHASREAGLWTNVSALRSSIFAWSGSSVTATLALPGGGSISGPVQLVEAEFGETGVAGALTATITLDLPNGELV